MGVMSNQETPPDLGKLERKLVQAREAHDARQGRGRSGLAAEGKGYAFAIRVSIELVSTLAVGLLIGWALDRWLGTGPWLLIAGLFLGAAAGALNVYRLSATIFPDRKVEEAMPKSKDDDEDES
jgi:ATP synthase protein I